MKLMSGGAAVVALVLCGCGPSTAPAADAPEQILAVEFSAEVKLAPEMFAVLVPIGADRAGVERAARDQCAGENTCAVMGWTDRDFMPRGFPMTDREVAAQAFSYRVNRNNGLDEFSWAEGINADPPA